MDVATGRAEDFASPDLTPRSGAITCSRRTTWRSVSGSITRPHPSQFMGDRRKRVPKEAATVSLSTNSMGHRTAPSPAGRAAPWRIPRRSRSRPSPPSRSGCRGPRASLRARRDPGPCRPAGFGRFRLSRCSPRFEASEGSQVFGSTHLPNWFDDLGTVGHPRVLRGATISAGSPVIEWMSVTGCPLTGVGSPRRARRPPRPRGRGGPPSRRGRTAAAGATTAPGQSRPTSR